MFQPSCLSEAAIDEIIAALPANCSPQRVALLPKILRDWSARSLPIYGAGPNEQLYARFKLHEDIRSLARQASKLLTALEKLDSRSLKAITLPVEALLSRHLLSQGTLSLSEIERAAKARLRTVEDWLAGVANIFDDCGASGKRGRPRAVLHRLVMTDLVTFWVYVTDTEPTRKVHGEDHPNRGKEYGPFWDFARAAWIAIFGSERSLSSGIRTWARERKARGDQTSLALVLVALRNPQWKIFDA